MFISILLKSVLTTSKARIILPSVFFLSFPLNSTHFLKPIFLSQPLKLDQSRKTMTVFDVSTHFFYIFIALAQIYSYSPISCFLFPLVGQMCNNISCCAFAVLLLFYCDITFSNHLVFRKLKINCPQVLTDSICCCNTNA